MTIDDTTNRAWKWLKKYKLTNSDASLTFESVEEFFNKTTSASVDVKNIDLHINLDDKWKVLKDSELAEDGKSVIITREFIDEDTHDKWAAERAELPSIDEGVTEEVIATEDKKNIRTENE
tara:strand:+ start:43 stop:405 length:363 start_codon:yes stop_codon:yes gene_type:complete